jgi:hypothetical protein
MTLSISKRPSTFLDLDQTFFEFYQAISKNFVVLIFFFSKHTLLEKFVKKNQFLQKTRSKSQKRVKKTCNFRF